MNKKALVIVSLLLVSSSNIAIASSNSVEINFGALGNLSKEQPAPPPVTVIAPKPEVITIPEVAPKPKKVIKKRIIKKAPIKKAPVIKSMPVIRKAPTKKTPVINKYPVIRKSPVVKKIIQKPYEPTLTIPSFMDETIDMMAPSAPSKTGVQTKPLVKTEKKIKPIVIRRELPKKLVETPKPIVKKEKKKPSFKDRMKAKWGGFKRKPKKDVSIPADTVLSDTKRALAPRSNAGLNSNLVINEPYSLEGNKKELLLKPAVITTPKPMEKKNPTDLPPIYDDNSYMPALPIIPVNEKYLPKKKIVVKSINKESSILNFTRGSSDISKDHESVLKNLIIKLNSNVISNITVTSYASHSHPAKADGKSISLARALSIRSYLMDNGVAPKKIDVQAFGTDETDPNSDQVKLIFN